MSYVKKAWAKLIILRQKLLKEEENSKKQKENLQERMMAELALSAKDQIHYQVDKSLIVDCLNCLNHGMLLVI